MRMDWRTLFFTGLAMGLLLTAPFAAWAENNAKAYDLKPVTHERLLKSTEDTASWLM